MSKSKLGWSLFPGLCWSLERATSRADESQSYPCVRKFSFPGVSKPAHLEIWISQAVLYLETVPTNAPSLAGVSVLVLIYQRMNPNQRFTLQNLSRQTIHRIPVTQLERNPSQVLGFENKSCPKVSATQGREGSGHIHYF